MAHDSAVRHPSKRPPRIPFAVGTQSESYVSRRFEAEGRKMWSGLGEGWTYLSTIFAGIAVWGGAGYGLDYWLGTRPIFFVIGALVGNFAGIYLVYIKSFRDEPATERRGVKRDAS